MIRHSFGLRRVVLVGVAVFGLAWLGFTPVAGAAPAPLTGHPHALGALHDHHHGPPAVVDVQGTNAYGPILVATFTGQKFPLYEISSDHPPFFGCTTTAATTFAGTFPCTGPETFTTGPTSSEWPALTTTAPPLGGPGVPRSLLGTVYRKGVGHQVTYAGHPLYLFSAPTTFFGEGFLETVLPLPPWHGLWDLVSFPTGNLAPGQAVMESGLSSGHDVLSVEEYPLAEPGGVAVAVYEFCAGPTHLAACEPGNAPPNPNWIPVLTQGPAKVLGGIGGNFGKVRTPAGTQVTYDGRPLYIYANEMAVFTTGVPQSTGTEGNGAGLPGPGGLARLITLP